MKIQASLLSVRTSAWALASAFCVASLAGCGANGNLTQSLGTDTSDTAAAISGTVHGGPNPVVGATVTLYATTTIASPAAGNNYGYGQAGLALGTATTTAGGNFSFASPAACTSGQQAYIVSVGGKAGTNTTANSAAVLMAALGPCSGLTEGPSGTHVIINEPTTIAAAYALSGFMTVTAPGVVNISAPANNNGTSASHGATGACTVVSNVTTACTAAGLAHAFLNAANLVNTNTGAVNATVPAFSSAIVPQALIYTLANSVEACVNTTGSMTTGTACNTLMTNTTPTQLVSASAPANTLQALLDLAQYPSEATGPGGVGAPIGGTAGDAIASPATTALYNLANSNAYYAPALTAAPDDFTIAINYPTAAAPWGLTTDINDNVYVYEASTPATIYGFSSNFTKNWSTPLAGTAGGGCGSFGPRCGMGTDTLGNVWAGDANGLHQMSTGGTLGETITTVDSLDDATVDQGNNVWSAAISVGTANGTQTTPSGVEELVQGQTAITDVLVDGSPITGNTNQKQPTFDNAGNMWIESDSVQGLAVGAILLVSSNNSLTAPSFNTPGPNGNPVLYTGGNGTPGNDPLIDSLGNMWIGSENELNEVTSSGTEAGGAENYATSMTIIYGAPSGGAIWEGGVERNATIDGDDKLIVDAASGGAGYLSVYYPNAPSDGNAGAGEGGADTYLNPCYVASGTTCSLQAGGQSSIVNAARSTVVDASGAIWASLSSGVNLVQVIGPGAPNWSQGSWRPTALATNTSGRPY